jgi:hypothetical protein
MRQGLVISGILIVIVGIWLASFSEINFLSGPQYPYQIPGIVIMIFGFIILAFGTITTENPKTPKDEHLMKTSSQ